MDEPEMEQISFLQAQEVPPEHCSRPTSRSPHAQALSELLRGTKFDYAFSDSLSVTGGGAR
jgi:hypothetical protein